MTTRSKRVLLVGSSGGHLAQLWNLRAWLQSYGTTWVTFDTPDAIDLLQDEASVWCYHPTTRSLWNLIRNAWLAVRVTARVKPDVVISTGAGVALPFFLVAKLFRVPTVFIEVYDRIDSPTVTGRLCRPLADVFAVQWDSQLAFYPGATLIGTLL